LEVAPPFATLAMERAASEQGKGTELFCKVQNVTPFAGPAQATLMGLPPGVTAPAVEITKDAKEFGFKVNVPKTSPAGNHRNIFCQLVVTQNGEPVVHYLGGTELRIDVPLPPKAEAPKQAAVAKAAPTAPAATKRLTRLEKLRQEQEEREKASKGGESK
jgi:hypothetical protein